MIVHIDRIRIFLVNLFAPFTYISNNGQEGKTLSLSYRKPRPPSSLAACHAMHKEEHRLSQGWDSRIGRTSG